MAQLVINDEEFEVEDGESIKDVCEEAGIPFACTEGICGTCITTVVEGNENLSEYNEAEQDFMGDFDDERMCCQCKILGGCVKMEF
ncbi:MAG: hypothetical protein S4CHLAM102_01420 [Chlamydiia bacterium]|nr:hypothetical protein [Chlamydiia bacterium]